MRTLAAIATLALLAPALAAEEPPKGCGFEVCSKHWYGTGVCLGRDQVPILQPPWEPRPISIIGVSIAVQMYGRRSWKDWWRGDPVNMYAFAGNSHVPDVMAFHAASGTSSHTVMYPPGVAFKLPAWSADAQRTRLPHVDLHVSCTGWGSFGAWLVIYYRVD